MLSKLAQRIFTIASTGLEVRMRPDVFTNRNAYFLSFPVIDHRAFRWFEVALFVEDIIAW